MPEPTTPRVLARRGFLQLIATAATAAAAVPAAALAQTAPATPAAPVAPEHTASEARLATEVLRARYPDRFSEAQWGSIVGDIEGDQAGGKRLRAVKHTNGDEPDFAFRP